MNNNFLEYDPDIASRITKNGQYYIQLILQQWAKITAD